MTARLVLILALALSALGGCASLAPELSGDASSAVQSAALLEDIRVARAYASLAAVRSGAASLLERGRIKVEDAVRVQATADAVRQGLDAARIALRAGREGSYQTTIGAALQLLAGLETFIQEKSK